LNFRIKCEGPNNITNQLYIKTFEEVVEPENHIGFVTTPFYFKSSMKLHRYGISSINEAHENIAPFYFGIDSLPDLKEAISTKALQLSESGIFMFIFKFHLTRTNFEIKPEPIGPQVLTLGHLGPSFIIISVLLGLCVLVFVVECTPRVSKKLFGAYLACYIVVKFTRMNKML
jgi:hypothetical protein